MERVVKRARAREMKRDEDYGSAAAGILRARFDHTSRALFDGLALSAAEMCHQKDIKKMYPGEVY